jgi:NAD(P)-dependent dehydrogenase (short-subunit alcohol dehydrogenase family)
MVGHAGLRQPPHAVGVLLDRRIFSMSAHEWDLVIRAHLRGHLVTTRPATAYWREARKATGQLVHARIVNTSSEAFLLGSDQRPAELPGADRDDQGRGGALPGPARRGPEGLSPVRSG